MRDSKVRAHKIISLLICDILFVIYIGFVYISAFNAMKWESGVV